MIDGSEDGIKNSSIEQIFKIQSDRRYQRIVRGHLFLEHFVGFPESFKKKVTNCLEEEFKPRISTRKISVDEEAIVTFSSLSVYKPTIIPSLETLRMLGETIMKPFKFSFESWTTNRKTDTTGRRFQLNIGSSSNSIALLQLLTAQ